MNMKGGISVALDRDADDDCMASKNLKKNTKIQRNDERTIQQPTKKRQARTISALT